MVLPIRSPVELRLCLVAACLVSSGCEALSPQQLWKLNRQPNMDRGDAYFSIPAEVEPDVEGDVVNELEAPDLSQTASGGR
jgi:hypothetical protein